MYHRSQEETERHMYKKTNHNADMTHLAVPFQESTKWYRMQEENCKVTLKFNS